MIRYDLFVLKIISEERLTMKNVKKLNITELQQIKGGWAAGIPGLVCKSGKVKSGNCHVDANWAINHTISQVGKGFLGNWAGGGSH